MVIAIKTQTSAMTMRRPRRRGLGAKLMAASAQASLDEAMGTFRAIATARSVREAMDLQAALARSTLEQAMTQTGQVAESTLKLTEQVVAPIASRFTLAVETFGRPA